MARLTWQNVAAPDLSTAAAAYNQVGRNFSNAFAGFGDIARGIARDRMNAASNAELARLAQVSGADQVDAYLRDMVGRVDPTQMNDNLISAVMGLRGNAQGYDTTRLNQANTRSVTEQRNQQMEFDRELREQSVGFNQALNEAYKEQELGNYSRADQIINDALRKFPTAASQANVGNINRDMRTIRSAPDANRFTEEGQLYEQNRNPIIETAVSTGYDEVSVKTAAFEAARNRGLSVQQATRIADEAFQVFLSGNSIGSPTTTPTSIPPQEGGASRVDQIIGTPDPSVVAPIEQAPAVVAPTTLGGLPIDAGTPAPVPSGSDMVDRILNPTAPQVPVETPMVTSTEQERPTTLRMTDPSYVREAIRNNPNEVIDSVLSEVRSFNDELDMQGGNSVQEAYRIFTTTDGAQIVEDDLYRDLSEDQKAEAKSKLQAAIIKVKRDAGNVSDKVAKAAILATLDPTNWYGALTSPNPSVSRAVEVARTLTNPQQSRALSERSARLSTFRERLNAEQEQFTTDSTTLQNLKARKPAMMSDEGYANALRYYEDKVANSATRIATLTQEAREFTGLPSGNESSNTGSRSIPSEPNIREQGTTSPRVVGSALSDNVTVDRIAPALREAGIPNTVIAANADAIQSDVDRIIRDAGRESRTYDTVQRAVDNIIQEFTDKSNPALLAQMSPEEIIETALADDSGPYSAQRDAAVWGNIKKALPDTKEFEPFKDMSPTELKRAAPRLLPLLQSRAVDNQLEPSDVVDRIIKKYTQ